MPVTFENLREAFDWANVGGAETAAYIDRESGKVFYESDIGGGDDEEELPDDLHESDRYLQAPDKRELDLGVELVFAFARDHLEDDYDELRDVFRRKGAYKRFRSLLERRGALDPWYAFENAAETEALKAWARDNDLEVVGAPPAPDSAER